MNTQSVPRPENSKQSNLQVRVITDPLQWEAIAVTWDQLFTNPMQSYAWLSAWWKYFKAESSAQLAILVVSQNNRDVAIAPLFVQRTKFGNTVQLLGSGEVCSDYLDLGIESSDVKNSNVEQSSNEKSELDVSASKDAHNWILALSDYVCSSTFAQQFGLVDCIELEGYSDQQPALGAFAKGIQDKRWGCEDVELEGCWITEFADTWAEYEKKISKSRRRKVRKAQKLIDNEVLTWNKLESKEELRAIWPDVVRLHQQRRGMLGQPGCFATDSFNSFLSEAFQQLAAEDRAFVATLNELSDDKPVIAVLLVLKAEAGWQIYQSGADPNAMNRDPGHTLNTVVLRDTFESGAGSMDFLRGDEPYKEGWFARRIPLKRTRLFGTHLSARLRFHALRAHRQWKNWTRGSRAKVTNGANHA